MVFDVCCGSSAMSNHGVTSNGDACCTSHGMFSCVFAAAAAAAAAAGGLAAAVGLCWHGAFVGHGMTLLSSGSL